MPMEKEIRNRIKKYTEQLDHPDAKKREQAVWALLQIGQPASIPPLAKALQHPDSKTRGDAAWALGEIGHPAAIPSLAKALQHADGETRGYAALALNNIAHSIQGIEVRGREAKALQLVGQYFREKEHPKVVHQAFQAALKGKVTKANARLYVKQLRAVKGSLK